MGKTLNRIVKEPGVVYAREGRPSAITKEVLVKLEQAFALDCTDEEACFYANISPSTLYDYQKKYPAFSERKKELKQQPFLVARQAIVKGIKDDKEFALKYMERKKKKEFGTKTEIDLNNPDGNLKSIVINKTYVGNQPPN